MITAHRRHGQQPAAPSGRRPSGPDFLINSPPRPNYSQVRFHHLWQQTLSNYSKIATLGCSSPLSLIGKRFHKKRAC